LPKLGLRFFFPAGDNSQIDQRRELGGRRYAPCPSYQLDRGRLENYLGDLCRERDIQFIDQANIRSVQLGSRGGSHEIGYQCDGQSQVVRSRWVIDASGRRALLKRQLGLQQESPHVANAAWFRFRRHIKIDDWSNDSQWHEGYAGKVARWYSTNHLMGQGYWVWLIPLASGSTSIGIVAAQEFHSLSDFNSFDKAVRWLERHEPQCAAVVRENADCLQDFRAIKRYSVESKQVFSAQRWGITGEAGFFHDPFYSPGSDFIAFANTFLCDLVQRDLSGRGIRIRAFAYDRIFKRFYHGTMTAYRDQYQMFGNPTVMPVKILWDYLMYWSITGFIFMHDQICHQSMYLRNVRQLSKLSGVNEFMQGFFRQWHERTEHSQMGGTVDIAEIPLIREMNERLKETMSNGDFTRRFAANVAQLQTLACEIVAHSGLDVPVPCRRSSHGLVRQNAFHAVFESEIPLDLHRKRSA
jgi:flavin-dependent dehydrogenase